MMELLDKHSWIVGLIGGGAFGAIITAFITWWRYSIQSVGYRFNIIPIFQRQDNRPSIITKVVVGEGENEAHLDNLFFVELFLINKGNKDLSEFKFGATFLNDDSAIYVEKDSTDRYHVVEQITHVQPNEQKSEIDFKLMPFNRKDSYKFVFFVTASDFSSEPSIPELSTSVPIKFVALPSFSDIAIEIASSSFPLYTAILRGTLKIR